MSGVSTVERITDSYPIFRKESLHYVDKEGFIDHRAGEDGLRDPVLIDGTWIGDQPVPDDLRELCYAPVYEDVVFAFDMLHDQYGEAGTTKSEGIIFVQCIGMPFTQYDFISPTGKPISTADVYRTFNIDDEDIKIEWVLTMRSAIVFDELLWDNRCYELPYTMSLCVDADGNMVGDPLVMPDAETRYTQWFWETNNDPYAPMYRAALCLDFLHADNISTRPYTAGSRPERRRIERSGVNVKTLWVTGQKAYRPSKDRQPGPPEDMPLTSVRGHFAHYGPKYGRGLLFGKIAGRFWIPAYEKGDAEFGEVHNVYALKEEG